MDLTDPSRFTFVETVQPCLDVYTAVVWSVALQRTIRLAYLLDRHTPQRPRFVVLFSTDVNQHPQQIYRYYPLRFQIEFLFRDAKQFTGLADCPARDVIKVEFHFNASLTALNLAKYQATARSSNPVRLLNGKCQTPCAQLPSARHLYCKLRLGAKCD